MSYFRHWLPSLLLRRVLATCLVSLLGLGTLGLFTLALAATNLTPEARSYQVDYSDRPQEQSDRPDLIETSRDQLRTAAETVREKLNLDEPLYPGTKDFLKDTEESLEDTAQTLTGQSKGYYQSHR